MFVGRKNELESLENSYRSGKAEFVAVYGRRRTGVTELVTQFCLGKPCVFYSCSPTTDKDQLERFSETVFSFSSDYSSFPLFKDWTGAFSFLARLEPDKKLVVVFDDFPEMVKSSRCVPSVLQNVWDHTLKDCNIMLIITGSSVKFVEGEILGAKNPLYGRFTSIYKVAPLSFTDAVKFFPSYSDEDKMLAYSVLGGMPYYLSQFDPEISLEENIKTKILRLCAPLRDEAEFLMLDEVREPAVYNAILSAVATGCATFAKIRDRTQMDSRVLSVYIGKLAELGLIKKEYPVECPADGTEKSSKAKFTVCDSYLRFWFAYVNRFRSRLDRGDTDGVWEKEIEGSLHSFASEAFINVCTAYMWSPNVRKNLPFRFNEIGRWWGNVKSRVDDGKVSSHTEEINILATDRDEERYIIGECDFTAFPFDMEQFKSLHAKLPIDGEIYYYLFSLNGFDDAVTKESENNPHITLVTLSDVLSV